MQLDLHDQMESCVENISSFHSQFKEWAIEYGTEQMSDNFEFPMDPQTSYISFNQNENYSPELHFYKRKANVVISELKSNLTGMIQ